MFYLLCSVWAQLLDRAQQRLVLVIIPLSLFVPTKTENSMDYDGMDPSETIKILVDETSDIWINVCCRQLLLTFYIAMHLLLILLCLMPDNFTCHCVNVKYLGQA